MTGGTALAGKINRNLAKACKEFGLGMGLGSCRMLLESDTYLGDFKMRNLIGDEVPFYGNLGIAQVDELLRSGEIDKIDALLYNLEVDGLVIHVNPFQEWLQPEGDRFDRIPVDVVSELLDERPDMSIIVKEVGQGIGPESLAALLKLPLEAIELAAYGGTNFSKLELLRGPTKQQKYFRALSLVGHSAEEMVAMINSIHKKQIDQLKCRQVIISGGIRDFLDGYFLINKLNLPGIYGQASSFLEHAKEDYEQLRNYVYAQTEGLKLATNYLRIKNYE
jgi:isopentenyl-diphosphate delta-isomerase